MSASAFIITNLYLLCFALLPVIWYFLQRKIFYEVGLPAGRPLFRIRKSCIQWVNPKTRVYLWYESSQNLGSPLLLFESKNMHSIQTKGHPKTTLTRFWPLLNIYWSFFDWSTCMTLGCNNCNCHLNMKFMTKLIIKANLDTLD